MVHLSFHSIAKNVCAKCKHEVLQDIFPPRRPPPATPTLPVSHERRDLWYIGHVLTKLYHVRISSRTCTRCVDDPSCHSRCMLYPDGNKQKENRDFLWWRQYGLEQTFLPGAETRIPMLIFRVRANQLLSSTRHTHCIIVVL